MENSKKQNISLEEIESLFKELIKEHTCMPAGIIIPGPVFEREMHNSLVKYFNTKRYDYQETNTEGEDS